MTLTLSNENPLANNDKNEILTLIDLLVLRVECLANESDGKPTNAAYPTVSKVDQNLIEYLYYLFAKFLRDESLTSTPTTPTMDKTNFVHVCQTLVRNGCFDLSPDQSSADTTISSDRTLTQQPSLHEYPSDQDTLVPEQQPPTEQDTWLVVDLEPTTSDDELANEESIVSDLLLTECHALIERGTLDKAACSSASVEPNIHYICPDHTRHRLSRMNDAFLPSIGLSPFARREQHAYLHTCSSVNSLEREREGN